MKQYQDMLRYILENGYDEELNVNLKGDAECRTGTFALSVWDYTMKFDLSDGKLPVCTVDKKPIKGAINEILWCMNGERKLSDLFKRKVYYWAEWPYALLVKHLKMAGQTDEEIPSLETYIAKMKQYVTDKDSIPPEQRILLEAFDDMGPLYGFQWRHWTNTSFATTIGRKPHSVDIYQEAEGIDQLAEVVWKLQNKPNDRRMIVTSWNVSDIASMVLPPCHACHINHYVSNGRLNVKMVQRSCDAPIGVPVNITMYAAYLLILAKIAGLKPGELTWSGDNVHIYKNQIPAVKEMLAREPMELPSITVPEWLNSLDDLGKLTADDFDITEYKSHPKLVIPVAV